MKVFSKQLAKDAAEAIPDLNEAERAAVVTRLEEIAENLASADMRLKEAKAKAEALHDALRKALYLSDQLEKAWGWNALQLPEEVARFAVGPERDQLRSLTASADAMVETLSGFGVKGGPGGLLAQMNGESPKKKAVEDICDIWFEATLELPTKSGWEFVELAYEAISGDKSHAGLDRLVAEAAKEIAGDDGPERIRMRIRKYANYGIILRQVFERLIESGLWDPPAGLADQILSALELLPIDKLPLPDSAKARIKARLTLAERAERLLKEALQEP